MSKLLRWLGRLVKWLVVGVVLVEVGCFFIITASNYLIYGKLREGSRVKYDAYALFLNHGGPRPTANNTGLPGNKNIWMFGGSTMRGSTDDDKKTIPSQVAQLLNREPAAGPVTVVNYGENSFNSLLETKYLQKLLIEQAPPPQVIIFYDGANDCAYFAQHRTPYGHHGYRRVSSLIESYYRSFFGILKPVNAAIYASFTKELYDKLRQTVIPLQADSPLMRQFLELTEKRYDHVQKLANCYGAQFLLIWQPVYWVETGEVTPAVRKQEKAEMLDGDRFAATRHNFQVTYEALAARLRQKPYFVEFQNILCSRTEPVYQADGVHLRDMGRRMVAEQISGVLKQKWLDRAVAHKPAAHR